MRVYKPVLAVTGLAIVALIVVIGSSTNSAAEMPASAQTEAGQAATLAPSIQPPAVRPLSAPEPDPTREPDPSPEPKPTPFSIAWISDTQQYTAADNEVFGTMTQWIADTRDDYNTIAVVQTGDIVYNPYRDYQWQNSAAAFDRLPEGMHIITAAGNHDFLEKNDPNTPYLDSRPDTDFDPSHAFDEEGYVYYTTFTQGGVPFLIFSLSYGHEIEAEDWINDICSRYPDHYGILCLHTYVDAGGYSSVGKRLIEGVVKCSPNIRLVLCGHARGTAYLPEELDSDGDGIPDRTVHQMMMNTQDDHENGVGYLRVLRFDPQADSIEVITYSPWLDHFGYFNYGGDRFGESRLLEQAGLSDFSPGGTLALERIKSTSPDTPEGTLELG